MKTVKIDITKTGIAIPAEMQAKAQTANALLESGKGAGNDFLGWVNLPSSISQSDIQAIVKQAAKLREKAEVVICIGIGLVTPPVGMCLYVACDIMKLPISRGAWALMPFIIATVICLALLIIFPQLVLWPTTWIGVN